MDLENLTRRNAMKGIVGIAGSLLLPRYAEAIEVIPFKNSIIRNGVLIETNGEGYVNYNYGRVVEDDKIPNVSLGSLRDNYKLSMNVPAERIISIELPDNNIYGGIDTLYGKFKMSVHGPGRAEIIKRDNNLVPLINVSGGFKINAGDYVEIESFVNDEDSLDLVKRITIPSSKEISGGKIRISSTAIHVNFSSDNGRKLSNVLVNADGYSTFFVDYHGIISQPDATFPSREKGNMEPLYIVNIGEISGIYIPTKAFAAVRDKERFWMRTTHNDQLRLRNASYSELQKYAGPITQHEGRIIQEHWEHVFKEKRRMEEELAKKTGRVAIVHPVGFYMTEEEILNEYYKKQKRR